MYTHETYIKVYLRRFLNVCLVGRHTICVYVRYAHPYTYTPIHIYTHTHIHTYTYTPIPTQKIPTNISRVFLISHTQTYRVSFYVGMGVYVRYIHPYTYTPTYTYTPIHIYTHTHIHPYPHRIFLQTYRVSS